MWTNGGSIGDGLIGCVVIVGVACVAFGAFLMWLIPTVWNWIKPIIHQVTA